MTEAITPAAPSQRLFFALWPDEVTRRALRAAGRGIDGRAVHPDDLHLTLAYLGSVAAGRLPCVLEAADRVAAAAFALTLTLTQCGHWRGPRVSWLAPAAPPDALAALVAELWQGLAGCGFTPESRPFRAHVTLTRKGRSHPPQDLPAPIAWPVREFVLVSSLSVPEPPRYKVLQRWPLAGECTGLENQ